MKPSFSSTAVATSDIGDRLQKAVGSQKRALDMRRVEALRDVQKKILDLGSRGLLRRREIVVVTTSDFERRYAMDERSQQSLSFNDRSAVF